LLEKLTLDVTRIGIGNMNAKTAREIEEKAKQLATRTSPVRRRAAPLHEALQRRRRRRRSQGRAGRGEAIFSEALDQLSRLHAIVKQGARICSGASTIPTLKPRPRPPSPRGSVTPGSSPSSRPRLVQNGRRAVQLAFNSHDDVARQEYVDTACG
jgi:hypothetical protein